MSPIPQLTCGEKLKMVSEGGEPKWYVFGESVLGASHERTGLPNEDTISWWPESGMGKRLILAVSDGHGSSQSFRSEAGSRFAVKAAICLIEESLQSLPQPWNLSAIKRWAEEQLPRELVRRWKDLVGDDLLDKPFTKPELGRLTATTGEPQKVVLDPILAYGATLLTVVVTELFILHLQLGDGDILLVSETGQVSRPPLPADERLFANETTSLCSRNSWAEFRSSFQVVSDVLPALILVSTDGYANSFVDEESFLKIGPDILKYIRSDGLDAVKEDLGVWLGDASKEGSGDDITLGILCRMDTLELPVGRVPSGQIPRSEELVGDDAEPHPPIDLVSEECVDTLQDEASGEETA